MPQVVTVADWAPHVGVGILTRLVSFARSALIMTVVDNPLTWKLGFRGTNEKDDVEGPFYILGSPKRQIDDGKAVVASAEYMNKYGPFLFVIDVKDEKGEPIPNATLDWWQADSEGNYYFATWTLRGKVTTDANGRAEVLSIRPGDYGAPMLGRRAGHIHLIVSDAKGRHRTMTTQAYVCPANKSEHMLADIANYARTSRPGNMMTCYSIPAANDCEKYWDLPELSAEDTTMTERVKRWNAQLKDHGVNREIIAVGQHELKLNKA
ncbi:hypothetical protein ONZ51_g11535 [Trametes cubensis]|uniref:Intradiol ring-cleavage dioxygenases domain-containing protein n=1 Tax=Trametes cubensis TaxID=1111947 RepID=A0AAD7X7S1_9APHY|nr:hypothetical protein ONZ51_g11535 [Trametes cubensis]